MALSDDLRALHRAAREEPPGLAWEQLATYLTENADRIADLLEQVDGLVGSAWGADLPSEVLDPLYNAFTRFTPVPRVEAVEDDPPRQGRQSYSGSTEKDAALSAEASERLAKEASNG